MESCRARSAAAIESWFTGAGAGVTSPFDSLVIGIRCDDVVFFLAFPLVVFVRGVESVCCAFTVDTPPKVRAIARIAQLLQTPIRIVSSPPTGPPFASSPRGRPYGRSLLDALRATTIVAARGRSGILRAV